MRGEFSRATFSASMRYGNVTMQQGRVQLDTDWNEKSELKIQSGMVYLDVWERDVIAATQDSLSSAAVGGPDSSSRQSERPVEDHSLRLVREVAEDGQVTSTLHAALGRADGVGGESFLLPALEVSVEGKAWRMVRSLQGRSPRDEVFVVSEDGGTSSITFGDGMNGASPAAGSRIVASYRFGNGGDVPETPRRRRSMRRSAR